MNNRTRRHLWLPCLAALLAISASGCAPEDPIAASCGAKLIFGDLVISEVLANPTGKDDGQEWFEVHNATAKPVNVKGVKITLSRLDGTGDKTWRLPALTIEAGGYLVLGNSDDAERPPYVHAGYDNKLSDMLNGGTRFVVKCGSKVVDEVDVGEATEAVALQLSSLNMDASANDKPGNWCPATTDVHSPTPDLWSDFKGTPGKANRPCAVLGKCMEGGEARDLNKPKAGDLQLNEVMFDPDGTESEREWIEVMAMADIDLNDIDLGKAKNGVPLGVAYTITDADCLKMKKGDLAVLAREPEPHLSGGLPDGSIKYKSLSMTNSKGHGVWVGIDGEVLDTATWTASKNGHSLARDPEVADKWCAATKSEPYGWAGDLYGTPGLANPPCK